MFHHKTLRSCILAVVMLVAGSGTVALAQDGALTEEAPAQEVPETVETPAPAAPVDEPIPDEEVPAAPANPQSGARDGSDEPVTPRDDVPTSSDPELLTADFPLGGLDGNASATTPTTDTPSTGVPGGEATRSLSNLAASNTSSDVGAAIPRVNAGFEPKAGSFQLASANTGDGTGNGSAQGNAPSLSKVVQDGADPSKVQEALSGRTTGQLRDEASRLMDDTSGNRAQKVKEMDAIQKEILRRETSPADPVAPAAPATSQQPTAPAAPQNPVSSQDRKPLAEAVRNSGGWSPEVQRSLAPLSNQQLQNRLQSLRSSNTGDPLLTGQMTRAVEREIYERSRR